MCMQCVDVFCIKQKQQKEETETEDGPGKEGVGLEKGGDNSFLLLCLSNRSLSCKRAL